MVKHSFSEPKFFDNGAVYAEVVCSVCGAVAEKHKFSNFYRYKTDDGWSRIPTPCGTSEPEKKMQTATDAYQFNVPRDCRIDSSEKRGETIFDSPHIGETRMTRSSILPIKKIEPVAEEPAEIVSPALSTDKPEQTISNHVFEERKIVNGDRVLELCKCGIVSYRYKDGTRKYVSKLHPGLLADDPPILVCSASHNSNVVTQIVNLAVNADISAVVAQQEIPEPTKVVNKRDSVLSGNHKFERKEIPEGASSVIEYCRCGLKSLRFAKGGRAYYGETGILAKAPPCTFVKPEVTKPIKLKSIPSPPRSRLLKEQLVKRLLEQNALVSQKAGINSKEGKYRKVKIVLPRLVHVVQPVPDIKLGLGLIMIQMVNC